MSDFRKGFYAGAACIALLVALVCLGIDYSDTRRRADLALRGVSILIEQGPAPTMGGGMMVMPQNKIH